MKKRSTFVRFLIAFMLICTLFFIGCYNFTFVNQPFSVEPGSSFEVDISVTQNPGTGAGFIIPYFGVLLPLGWTVNDSIVFSYGTSFGMLVYSDSLTQLMYSLSPSPLSYQWWVAESIGEIYHCVNQVYLLTPEINTTEQPGMFYLDYMAGDNSNGLNYKRSDDHLITIDMPESVTVTNSNNNGPGSLRSAIDAVDFYGSIYFDLANGDTIFLQDQLIIYKDINIMAPADNPVVISGINEHRVLHINEERNPILSNMHIVDGNADSGGGIYCSKNSTVTLQNVKVADNTAENKGGGIFCEGNVDLVFDSIQKCNVYHNRALWGHDIYAAATELIVDTFSVLHPSEYHIYPRSNFTCDISNGKSEEIDADVYVSSEGNNTNSGLTADDPFKTIDHAFSVIRADSLHQNVIYLLNGTFKTSVNEEFFPIIVPDYISLSGESESGVILDAEEQSTVVIIDQNSATNISGLTLTGGLGGLSCNASIPDLQHITITDNQGYGLLSRESNFNLTSAVISNNNYQDRGAGIRCTKSDPFLKDVIISNNTSESCGGGIYFENSNPFLENVTISHNSAEYGGGIHCHSSDIEFDSIHRCNIYLNSASYGNDLRLYSYTHVILDTFSVIYPTEFYADPLDACSFDILNGKTQQVDDDLYVSPFGDDTNSGLTTSEPLKTIRNAMSKIIADSARKNTIRLLEGIYGPSTNEEIMPLVIPSDYTLRGTSAHEVILDAEGQSGVLIAHDGNGITISDLTITGGNAEYGGGISSNGDIRIENTIIRNNTAHAGGGIDFGAFMGGANAVLQNVVITDNYAVSRGGGIYSHRATLMLQNVTVSNNEGDRGGGIFCSDGSDIILYNSIFSNNTEEVHFLGFNAANHVHSFFSNIYGSLVYNSNGSFNWVMGNIRENPLFENSGDHPYALSFNSPCIDAGIPDTVGYSLPHTDIMGNERIWDGDGNGTEIMDMGAYEFASLPVGIPGIKDPVSELGLEVYPNPVRHQSVVSYQLSVVSMVKVALFDIHGKECNILVNESQFPGKHRIRLDVADLPSGIYFCTLKVGNEVRTEKIVKY